MKNILIILFFIAFLFWIISTIQAFRGEWEMEPMFIGITAVDVIAILFLVIE